MRLNRGFVPVILLALAGCAVNPVTGKSELSLVSEAWELKTGEQNYLPLRQSQGGDYVVDPAVEAYVKQVGQRLAAVSDRKLPYEFNVINSSVPNAWALPGGKISVNRGLLTELESESELAAVLGHEIVHAAARHGAKGQQRGILLQTVVLGASIATRDEDYGELATLGAGIGAALVNTKYGRDAESESDKYGMIYMSRAGYDPQGAVELQKTFVKMMEGKKQNWLEGLFASHPPSRKRIEDNIEIARSLPAGGEVGRERYLKMVARLLKSKPAYESYDKARKALAEGDVRQARTLAEKAVALEPREGHFHALLGDVEFKKKRYQSAVVHYGKAISRNDAFYYYHLRRGLVYEKLDQRKQARLELDRSNQLLPTASAYNALGNLSRRDGDLEAAKKYYAQVADQKGEAGDAAFGSLVEIDLAENPQKYIHLKDVRDSSSRWYVEVENPTPRAVRDVTVMLEYPDGAGVIRRRTERFGATIPPRSSRRFGVQVAVNPKLAKRYKSRVVSATPVQ